jgi:hypothetical protein
MNPGDHSTASRPPDQDDAPATPVWAEVPAQLTTLIDTPELLPLVAAIVAAPPRPQVAPAIYTAVLDALARCQQPTAFGGVLELLLDSRPALEHLAQPLSDLCLHRAQPPAPGADLRAWLVAADALEAATRLALGGWVPHFGVLAQLVRLPAPTPPLFARPALRCLAAAYEQWREPALLSALTRQAQQDTTAPPSAVDPATALQWTHEVASDVAYELGAASLLQALRSPTMIDVEMHLQDAERRLALAADNRDDAAVLVDVVGLLHAHLPTQSGRAIRTGINVGEVAARLEHRVRGRALNYAGWDHWRAARLDAEVAWAQLAADIATSTAALQQASWYDAERVLADVLAAYSAFRCSRVLQREDTGGVRAILGPDIESGIAAQAGLIQHLHDHVQALEAVIGAQPVPGRPSIDQASDRGELSREAELDAARSLLTAARARIAATDADPKRPGSAASAAPDWPAALSLLHQLLGGTDASADDAINTIDASLAQRLETALATASVRPRVLTAHDSLVVADTHARLRRELAGCPHYRGEVAEVVDRLMLHLLRFWRRRHGVSSARKPYLFDAAAKEAALADDLEDSLALSEMSAIMTAEVRDIGGGRVDILCSLSRFRLVIELKKDARQVPVTEKRRYLAQTAGYQDADVLIGFLAVLDLSPRTGPAPDLDSCFEVVLLDDPDLDLGRPRHIVTMAVPGNRTEPSAMR